MRKITITLTVAIATIFAFSSCQKDTFGIIESVKSVRTITGIFENTQTRTTLNSDGKTPEWAVGDKIRVLSATSYQDVTLTDAEENPTTPGQGIIKKGAIVIGIPETMTGTLYAVYPASVTTMEYCGDGNITFTIPAIQDGTFASANICVAKSSTTDETNKDNLMFCNATAVLAFSQTAVTNKVLGVRVEAANAIVGPMTVGFKADGTLDTPTTSSLSGQLIRVKSSEAKDKYYIAAAPVATGRIEFEYQQAIKVATVTTEAGKTLAANKIYACPSMDGETYEVKKGTINGHDYVQIGSVKWATMNIGATTLTGTGDYYMWGAVEKPYSSLLGNTFTFYSAMPSSYINNTWNADKCFSPLNCQFTKNIGEFVTYGIGDKNVFTKYSASKAEYSVSGTADGKTVLEPEDDAATYNWGSTWRMPEGGNASEFIALYNVTYWAWDDTDKGYYVYAPNPPADAGQCKDGEGTYNKSDALLFFPAGGMGIDGNISNGFTPGVKLGGYWTRTLNSENPLQAHHFNFASDSGVNTDVNSSNARSIGFLIRPVSE